MLFRSPLGRTSIVRKEQHPAWIPGPAVRAEQPDLPSVVPAGPDNPLGDYALYLGFDSYLVHGTNRPWGVGRRVSHGCIRLYPEDIAALFPTIAVGTPVTVVDQRVKLGWADGVLYLEAHPEPIQIASLEESGALGTVEADPIDDDTVERLHTVAGEAFDRIDWAALKDALAVRRGLPVPIARQEASY